MREQHPLDDLFARSLRDAEATPSDAVWDGIVQERGWAHMTLLQLRRNWGWPALLLLLACGGGYLAITSSGEKDAVVSGSKAQNVEFSLAASSAEALSSSFINTAPEGLAPSGQKGASAPIPSSSTITLQSIADASVAGNGPQVGTPDYGQRSSDPTIVAPSAGTLAVASGADRSLTAATLPVDVAVSEEPASGTTYGASTAELPKSHLARETTVGPNDRSETRTLDNGHVGLLSARVPKLDRELLPTEPQNETMPTFAGPRQAWWVAVTVGQYRETRSWHGADAQLVKALEGTEMPHRTTNFGVLAGIEGRKGWGIATGLEYGAARYDFQHYDQFRSNQDSLVTHVVTFNTLVLDSYVDTISTFTEVRRTVAAVNRYTTLRLPVEGSWHRAWRRWHVGLRGGVAAEFNTMRSGVTLMRGDGGTRSVDVSTAEKRTTTLVSGGLAVDVGYALTERLGLWASPGYAAGLFSLSPNDGLPYAVPERLGVRIRLAYTLRPGQ